MSFAKEQTDGIEDSSSEVSRNYSNPALTVNSENLNAPIPKRRGMQIYNLTLPVIAKATSPRGSIMDPLRGLMSGKIKEKSSTWTKKSIKFVEIRYQVGAKSVEIRYLYFRSYP